MNRPAIRANMAHQRLTPDKRIHIPVYGAVDVSEVKDIIDSETFQRTQYISQTAGGFTNYRGMTHTRFVHMVGTYAQAREFALPLARKEMITGQEAREIQAAGLLHDIGHGPYSHLLERILPAYDSRFPNHNVRTDHLLRKELSDVLKKDGLDPDKVGQIIAKKHPLNKLISHKTLGSDKISYLRMDHHFANYPDQGLRIGDLAENLVYVHDVLGTVERMRQTIADIQNFYFAMYTDVYFNKQKCATERILERGVQLAFEDGALHPDQVWDLLDMELLLRLRDTKGPWQDSIKKTFFGPRALLKAAVSFHLPGHEDKEKRSHKHIVSVAARADVSRLFEFYNNPKNLLKGEQKIAQKLKTSLDEVAISICGGPGKLLSEDVQFFSPYGEFEGTFFGKYKEHLQALKERADSESALRVMVAPDIRKKAAKKADAISDLLYDLMSDSNSA